MYIHTYDGTTDGYVQYIIILTATYVHTCRGRRGSRLVNCGTICTKFFSLWDQYINIIIIAMR